MRMRRRQIIAGCGALWGQTLLMADAEAFAFGPPSTLEEMARRVESEFRQVTHLPTGELAARDQGASALHLFDVRERDEFDVSHLNGAERIAPNISTASALGQIGPRAEDAVVVFYCSVGQRSSRLAARTQSELEALGARAVYNLRGGVFAWHNESRPLVDRWGPTPYVHPFSERWRRLLTNPQLSAFRVRTAAQ